MKRLFLICFFLIFLTTEVFAVKVIHFSFEKSSEGWEIPRWVLKKGDYVGTWLNLKSQLPKRPKPGLELVTNFEGKRWQSAIVEIKKDFNLISYQILLCDLYIPENAPRGISARLILTSGENWLWTEMATPIQLKPGSWTTISADLRFSQKLWRNEKDFQMIDRNFKSNIKKIGIRIESDRIKYTGPIYINNVKIR